MRAVMRARSARARAARLPCSLVLAALWAACGGADKGPAQPAAGPEFACKDRRAAYIVTGSFAGPEVGVVMDCAEVGPRISKWIVLDEDGDRRTMEHSLTPGEFDALWDKIESTGWRHLGDCDNPQAAEGDPAYKIGVKDHVLAVTMNCAGKELPFPYNRLVNELDLKAAEYGD